MNNRFNEWAQPYFFKMWESLVYALIDRQVWMILAAVIFERIHNVIVQLGRWNLTERKVVCVPFVLHVTKRGNSFFYSLFQMIILGRKTRFLITKWAAHDCCRRGHIISHHIPHGCIRQGQNNWSFVPFQTLTWIAINHNSQTARIYLKLFNSLITKSPLTWSCRQAGMRPAIHTQISRGSPLL